MEDATRTATVERQTIQSSISSSGTLAALDTYTITSLVSGEVIRADFEKGDPVSYTHLDVYKRQGASSFCLEKYLRF